MYYIPFNYRGENNIPNSFLMLSYMRESHCCIVLSMHSFECLDIVIRMLPKKQLRENGAFWLPSTELNQGFQLVQ